MELEFDSAPSSSGPGHSVLNARTPVRLRLEPPGTNTVPEELIQKNMHKLLACLLISFLLFFVPNHSWAASKNQFSTPTGGQINEAIENIVPIRYLPDHPLYLAVILKENVSRFFKPSAVKRAEFDHIRASKRIKESYMLSKIGKVDKAATSLRKYSSSLNTTAIQIEKARSQNQDVVLLASIVAENLKHQEVLLLAMIQDDKITGLVVLDASVSAFDNLVMHLDNIMPGVKNRFELLKVKVESVNQETRGGSTTSVEAFSTPSANPLRIIR